MKKLVMGMMCGEYVGAKSQILGLFVRTRVQLVLFNVICESWYVIRTLLLPRLRALAGSFHDTAGCRCSTPQ